MEFTTLRSVVNAVAQEIPLPSEWEGRFLTINGGATPLEHLKAGFFNGFLELNFRHASAAALLDQALANALLNESVCWFDSAATDLPKVSENAQRDGVRILEHQANWTKRFWHAYYQGKVAVGAVDPTMGDSTLRLQLEDSNRMNQLHFKTSAIIRLLDAQALRYNLDDLLVAHPSELKSDAGDAKRHQPRSALPAGVPSPAISQAFAGLNNWKIEQWRSNLGDPPKWLADCRIDKGNQKTRKPAKWNPVAIADCLRKEAPRKKLDAVFDWPALKPWREEWERWALENLAEREL